MTTPQSSVLQFSDGHSTQSALQFQDFTDDPNKGGVATLNPSESYTSFPDNPDANNVETDDLLGGEQKRSSFWELGYYQSFFDVDTSEVLQRLFWSMIPLPGRATFLDRQIRPKPDLYGPFWIAATLVFSIAICANVTSYLISEGQSAWSYDFHKVSIAATAIYSYVFLLPIMLFGFLYRQESNEYTLLEILCVYGYSLAIYVPVSVLWVIRVPWLQWILVIVAAGLSGTVLIQTFWPIFRDTNKKIAAVVLCLILLFHTLLAVGFVVFFFHPMTEASASPVVPVVPPTSSHIEKTSTIAGNLTDGAVNIASRSVEVETSNNNTVKNEHNDNRIKDGNSPPASVKEMAKNENAIDKEMKSKEYTWDGYF